MQFTDPVNTLLEHRFVKGIRRRRLILNVRAEELGAVVHDLFDQIVEARMRVRRAAF